MTASVSAQAPRTAVPGQRAGPMAWPSGGRVSASMMAFVDVTSTISAPGRHTKRPARHLRARWYGSPSAYSLASRELRDVRGEPSATSLGRRRVFSAWGAAVFLVGQRDGLFFANSAGNAHHGTGRSPASVAQPCLPTSLAIVQCHFHRPARAHRRGSGSGPRVFGRWAWPSGPDPRRSPARTLLLARRLHRQHRHRRRGPSCWPRSSVAESRHPTRKPDLAGPGPGHGG